MQKPVRIAPSILSADFSCLGNEISAVSKAGADWIHIDVMDGHFVPNITIGPQVINAIREVSPLPFDVHLMIAPVDPYIQQFADAGADIITAHIEACEHIQRTIQFIKGLGKRAGISLNPSTPASSILHLIDIVDLVLVMTVNPGFGGQSFIENQLSKIQEIRTMIDRSGRDIDLEVDGGINTHTAQKTIEAGADVLVAGTAVFKESLGGYQENITKLRGI